MTDINKAEVYRKAAEIIVRDGKTEGDLTAYGSMSHHVTNPALPVCALGACARAEWELYGTLPGGVGSDQFRPTTTKYSFDTVDDRFVHPHPVRIWMFNDHPNTSAEDVALILKRRAEEIDG